MKQVLAMMCCLWTAATCFAQDGEARRRTVIDDGLAWLVKQQNKDGSWSAGNVGFPAATTAFAGMALLADGHSADQGKYSVHVRRAFEWYVKNAPKKPIYKGLFADPDNLGSTGRYMPEHGVAMSFLSRLYGEMENPKERASLRDMLKDAIEFSVKGQASGGGWYYTSKIEGHDSIENVATMVVIQGLLDARDMGLPVPKDTLKRAFVHLERCTTVQGGISYSGGLDTKAPPVGGGRPVITAMALAAFLPKGGPIENESMRKWLSSCKAEMPFKPVGMERHFDLLLPFAFSKVVFHLHEKQWEKAFPDEKMPDHLKWASYRKSLLQLLYRTQDKDGSWGAKSGWNMGPVFQTSLALNILLYEDTQVGRLHHR